MTNREIIKQLAKEAHKKSYWYTFSRYIILLDNYIDGKTLSLVENTNHPHNEPRSYYIDLLAKGFGVEMNLDSPLWEGRMRRSLKRLYFKDDSWCYPRFFERLEWFRQNNLPVNPETIDQMVVWGSVQFNRTYNYPKE